jgi:hypothetical protein
VISAARHRPQLLHHPKPQPQLHFVAHATGPMNPGNLSAALSGKEFCHRIFQYLRSLVGKVSQVRSDIHRPGPQTSRTNSRSHLWRGRPLPLPRSGPLEAIGDRLAWSNSSVNVNTVVESSQLIIRTSSDDIESPARLKKTLDLIGSPQLRIWDTPYQLPWL